MKQKRVVNKVWCARSEAALVVISPSVDDQFNQIDDIKKQHNNPDANYDSNYNQSEDNCVAVISDNRNLRER